MRLPATLLGTLRLGLATTALATIGCDALATAPASSAGVFGTMPLVATAARSDALAQAVPPEPARAVDRERTFPLESRGRVEPSVPERRVESPRSPAPIAVAEPAPKPKRAHRRPVRAVAPEPAPVGPPKGWVCGPCGMG